MGKKSKYNTSYRRGKHGAVLLQIVHRAGASLLPNARWTRRQRAEIVSTARARWGGEEPSCCWRQRAGAAMRGADQRLVRFSSAVRSEMRRRRLNDTDLAAMIGMTTNRLESRLRGDTPLADDTAKSILSALGLSPSLWDDPPGQLALPAPHAGPTGDPAESSSPAEDTPLPARTERCPACGAGDPHCQRFSGALVLRCRCGHRWVQGHGLPGKGPRDKALQPPPAGRPASAAPDFRPTAENLAASFHEWCRDHLPVGIDPAQALADMGVKPAKDPGMAARVRCAATVLRDQWQRYASTGKWCDPYRVQTALAVLDGTLPAWDQPECRRCGVR